MEAQAVGLHFWHKRQIPDTNAILECLLLATTDQQKTSQYQPRDASMHTLLSLCCIALGVCTAQICQCHITTLDCLYLAWGYIKIHPAALSPSS